MHIYIYIYSSLHYGTCRNDAHFLANCIIHIFISPTETTASKNTTALSLQSKKNQPNPHQEQPHNASGAETSYATVLAVATTLSSLVNSFNSFCMALMKILIYNSNGYNSNLNTDALTPASRDTALFLQVIKKW